MLSAIDHLNHLAAKANDVMETRLAIWKLRAANKIASSVAALIPRIASVFFLLIAFVMLSFALGAWLAQYFESAALGYAVVGGIYLIIAGLIHATRASWRRGKLVNEIAEDLLD